MSSVDVSGPLFDHRADRACADYADELVREVADAASSTVHEVLNTRIKHPTPYYETQITTQYAPRLAVVHDRGIVYGPWLEGTGSRNFPVTRFRGYGAFASGRETAQRELPRIAEQTLRKFLPRMN